MRRARSHGSLWRSNGPIAELVCIQSDSDTSAKDIPEASAWIRTPTSTMLQPINIESQFAGPGHYRRIVGAGIEPNLAGRFLGHLFQDR